MKFEKHGILFSLTKVSFGIVARTQAVVQSHMMVMTGSRQMAISFHRINWYFAGSWNPAMTSWTPITRRHTP